MLSCMATRIGGQNSPASVIGWTRSKGTTMPVYDATFVGKIYLPDPPEPIPPEPPSGETTLLTPGDLEYLGSYVPDAVNEGLANWGNYSWGVPAFRWIDGVKHMYLRGPNEMISGYPQWPALVLWRVPTPTKGSPASCTAVRTWAAITGGQPGTYDTGVMQAYGEAAVMYPITWISEFNLLAWQYSGIYNGNYSNPVLGYTELRDDGSTRVFGPWRPDLHSKKMNASLVPIPASFHQYIGGAKWAAGGKTHSQIEGGNIGAGLHVFNLPDPSTPPDHVYPDQHASYHAQSLLDYDCQNPQPRELSATYDLCNWACALPNPPAACTGIYDSSQGGPVHPAMPFFSGSKPAAASCVDWLEQFCWIETATKRGILYCGQANLTPEGHERKHNWYGSNPCAHGQVDLSWQATGPGGGYVATIGQIFDPQDLVSVGRRLRSPRSAKPFQEFLWNSICPETGAQAGCISALSAVVFDPVDETVTLTQRIGYMRNYTAMPRFFVFKVKA